MAISTLCYRLVCNFRLSRLGGQVYPAVAVHPEHVVAVVVEPFARCDFLNHLFHNLVTLSFTFRYTIFLLLAGWMQLHIRYPFFCVLLVQR